MREIKENPIIQTASIIPESWSLFAPNLQIISGSNLISFNPYPYQLILADIIKNFSNIVIIKTRQLGVTEFLISLFLHHALLNAAYAGAIISLRDDDAKNNSERCRQMIASLPNVKTVNDNVHHLKIANGGSIHFRNSSSQGTRGRALSHLFIDEAAHYNDRAFEAILSASTPSLTMSESAKQFFVTTPSGLDSYFCQEILLKDNDDVDLLDCCKRVASGELYKKIPGMWWYSKNDTVKIILHWLTIPKFRELDEQLKDEGGYLKWRQRKNNLSEPILLRDFSLRFISGEEAVFTAQLVENTLCGQYEESRQKNCRYIAGLDTNYEGDNWLVLTIIKEEVDVNDTVKMSLVQMYRNRKRSQEYHLAEMIPIIRRYKVDEICIERNGGGAFYLERIQQELPHIHCVGIDTNYKNKPLMVERLLSAMERELLILPPDTNLRKELLSFSRVDDSYEGVNCSDDIVMSLCMCLNVSKSAMIPPDEEGFNFDQDLLQRLNNYE